MGVGIRSNGPFLVSHIYSSRNQYLYLQSYELVWLERENQGLSLILLVLSIMPCVCCLLLELFKLVVDSA